MDQKKTESGVREICYYVGEGWRRESMGVTMGGKGRKGEEGGRKALEIKGTESKKKQGETPGSHLFVIKVKTQSFLCLG